MRFQRERLPIHVVGAFPHRARRTIRYGDGRIPGDDIREALPKFRDMAQEAGRDPKWIETTSFAPGEDLDRVKRLNEMGVARVVPMFPPEKADKMRRDLAAVVHPSDEDPFLCMKRDFQLMQWSAHTSILTSGMSFPSA